MANPNMDAAVKAADLLTNALAQLRYTRDMGQDAREDLLRQVSASAYCLNALAFNGYDFAWDLLKVWRSELFRLGIGQDLDSFAGQSPDTSIRSNP